MSIGTHAQGDVMNIHRFHTKKKFIKLAIAPCVFPAKAGIHLRLWRVSVGFWIPAFAGMTRGELWLT